MNWDAVGAVGDLLGSIAVIVTLLYLVRQIKSAEIATWNANVSSLQSTRIAVRSHRLDHIELVLRANEGLELNQVEAAKMQILYQNQYDVSFFTFLNMRRLGQDGVTQAQTFAEFLNQNPGMYKLWQTDQDRRAVAANDWRTMVNQYLSGVTKEEG